MEYIKFNKQYKINDILQILNKLSINYIFEKNKEQLILGVSNGLYKINQTLCFIENIKNEEQLKGMEKSCIFTNEDNLKLNKKYNMIILNDCRFAFIKTLEYFKENNLLNIFSTENTFSNKYISNLAKIHKSAIIENNVVINDDVNISAGCIIKNGTYIGKNSIIRENTIIGCDGISLYKSTNGQILRFPHIAGVYIGENVEIGANCVIAKGTLYNTKINDNTVIGNLSNVGHGVKIGKKVWISVGGMIGGNCTIEDNVSIGLGVSLKDNLFISESSTIGMGSVVTKSLNYKATVFGNPAKHIRQLTVGPKR